MRVQTDHLHPQLSNSFFLPIVTDYFVSVFAYIVLIGSVGRVFANGPVDLGSIPVRVIPKTVKMALDTSLLNTQQYKVRIKGKME